MLKKGKDVVNFNRLEDVEKKETHNVTTNEKRKENNSAPISAFGDIAATAYDNGEGLSMPAEFERAYLADSPVVQRVDDCEHQEGISRAVVAKPDSPIPGEKEQGRSEDIPGHLDSNLSGEERSPTVHATRAFSDLVDVAKVDERHHKLAGKRNTDMKSASAPVPLRS